MFESKFTNYVGRGVIVLLSISLFSSCGGTNADGSRRSSATPWLIGAAAVGGLAYAKHRSDEKKEKKEREERRRRREWREREQRRQRYERYDRHERGDYRRDRYDSDRHYR